MIIKKRRVYSAKKPNGEPILESGFTLIEVLIVIGIIAVLAAVVLVAINPARQFKLARDSQRVSNVNTILNAVWQNITEHGGTFTCGAEPFILPVGASIVIAGSHRTISADIASCLVPNYVSALPFDPSIAGSFYTSTSSYDTNYKISQDASERITVTARGEITDLITITR